MNRPGLPDAPPAEASPYPWLLADIGGTNARFSWVEQPDGGIVHPQTLPVAGREGPLAAAREYLAGVARALGPRYRAPRSAAWAVATAITGDEVTLTNAGWRFSRVALQRELGLATFVLLNDFEALALSLPGLGAAQLQAVGAGPRQAAAPDSVRAVIGPGTGLGVAGLAPAPGIAGSAQPLWLPLPGEGGHATLAAGDDLEWALLAAVRRHHAHVSAERVLSGIGLPDLHRAVREVRLGPGTAPSSMRTEDIVAAGTARAGEAGADPLCRETLEHFCALLGSFAGNVALTLGARGGVYLGGGLLPRFGELFLHSRFRERFEAKGRFDAYLRAIPTWLITDTRAALSGAAMALQQRRAR